MKIGDVLSVLVLGAVALFLTLGRETYNAVYAFSPVLVAFAKFAILATLGEMIISRIVIGRYLRESFGLIPKALIWGILGIAIYFAFVIFEGGVTALLFGGDAPGAGGMRLVHAFSISVFMNLIFAPVLMTTHRMTDHFIESKGGRFPLRELSPGEVLAAIDWDRMWGFVLARTIPLFWIPAHTITFLLPEEFRLVFAAGLSVALGLFLALARKPGKSTPARAS
jgi:hypothetical protein